MKLFTTTAAAVVGALVVIAAVAVFRFHNAGDADVHIIRAKPS